jgi:hypothetical protein
MRGNVEFMGDKRNAYKILVGKSERDHLDNNELILKK